MIHASLFSGIGGFDLAAEWMGWENLFHCEWNPFGQRVLKHHFPNSISYNDITKTDFTIHEGSVDILTGGFPCQPYSNAGKRLGKADERHLFPHMLRCIKEVKPKWIIGENVRGLVNWNGACVEREGYEVQPFLIPAAGVNAPHRRDRIWFIAYSNNNGTHSRFGQVQEKDGKISKWNNDAKSGNTSYEFITNSNNQMRFRQGSNNRKWENNEQESNNWNCLWNNIRSISKEQYVTNTNFSENRWKIFPTQSPVCGGDDGLPKELDNITFPKWRNESIKAYGNAIVPQVAYEIFKAINEFELMVNK